MTCTFFVLPLSWRERRARVMIKVRITNFEIRSTRDEMTCAFFLLLLIIAGGFYRCHYDC